MNNLIPDSMLLPKGKTCADCVHFTKTCKWLIACNPNNTNCDWNPSRYQQKQDNETQSFSSGIRE